MLNSSDVELYQNTFVNSTATIARNGRSATGDRFGWHPSTGPDLDQRDGHVFVNNLLVSDENYTRSLLVVAQPPALCGQLDKPQLKQLDYNVYVRRGNHRPETLIIWSPAKNNDCLAGLGSPGELGKLHPEFSAHSRYFARYDGPLFKSCELGNYQVLQSFPGAAVAAPLPDGILRILEKSGKDSLHTGAFPPVP